MGESLDSGKAIAGNSEHYAPSWQWTSTCFVANTSCHPSIRPKLHVCLYVCMLNELNCVCMCWSVCVVLSRHLCRQRAGQCSRQRVGQRQRKRQMGHAILKGSRCSYISCMCFSLVFIMHVCVYLCLHCEVLQSQTWPWRSTAESAKGQLFTAHARRSTLFLLENVNAKNRMRKKRKQKRTRGGGKGIKKRGRKRHRKRKKQGSWRGGMHLQKKFKPWWRNCLGNISVVC